MKLVSLTENPENQKCLLLNYRSTNILIDCGIDATQLLHFLPFSHQKFDNNNTKSNNGLLYLNPFELDGIKVKIPNFSSIPPTFGDISRIDVVLISNFRNILALPYLATNPDFKGKIYATQPTIEFGKELMQEFVEYCEKKDEELVYKEQEDENLNDNQQTQAENEEAKTLLLDYLFQWKKPYRLSDIEETLSKITPVSFNQQLYVSNSNFKIVPVSSSFCIGGANWVIETIDPFLYLDFPKIETSTSSAASDSSKLSSNSSKIGGKLLKGRKTTQKIAILAQSCSANNRHPTKIDVASLKDADVLIVTDYASFYPSISETEPRVDSSMLINVLCAEIFTTLQHGGDVLIPVFSSGIIYDLIEYFKKMSNYQPHLSPHAVEFCKKISSKFTRRGPALSQVLASASPNDQTNQQISPNDLQSATSGEQTAESKRSSPAPTGRTLTSFANVPFYFISPTAEHSLRYSNICSEFLCETRQAVVFNAADKPFFHEQLMNEKQLNIFEVIDSEANTKKLNGVSQTEQFELEMKNQTNSTSDDLEPSSSSSSLDNKKRKHFQLVGKPEVEVVQKKRRRQSIYFSSSSSNARSSSSSSSNSSVSGRNNKTFVSIFQQSRIHTPSVIFAGHPSLRMGEAVHFLKWFSTNPKNTLMCIESEFQNNLELMLSPYFFNFEGKENQNVKTEGIVKKENKEAELFENEDSKMKIFCCPIDVRLTEHQLINLCGLVQPGRIVIPSLSKKKSRNGYTLLTKQPNPSSFISEVKKIIPEDKLKQVDTISYLQELNIPLSNEKSPDLCPSEFDSDFELAILSENLAKSLFPNKIPGEEMSIAKVNAVVEKIGGIFYLEKPNEEEEAKTTKKFNKKANFDSISSDFSFNKKSCNKNANDFETHFLKSLITKLTERGIDHSSIIIHQKTENSSPNFVIEIVDWKAKVIFNANETTIDSDSEIFRKELTQIVLEITSF